MANIAKQPSVFEVGADFDLWYTQFSAYCTICKVTVETKYSTLITFLSPRSYSLVNSLSLSDAQKANIDEESSLKAITNALTVRKNNVPFRIQLQHTVQDENESLSDFMYSLEKLGNKAYPGNDNNVVRTTIVVDQFRLGVHSNDLSVELLKNTYQSTHDVLDAAQKFESAYEIIKLRKTATSQSLHTNVDVLANTSYVHTTNNANAHSNNNYSNNKHGYNNTNSKGNSERPRQYNNNVNDNPNYLDRSRNFSRDRYRSQETRTCYTCNMPGHLSFQCNYRAQETRICYTCNRAGHLSFQCRSKSNKRPNKSTKYYQSTRNNRDF